MEKFFLIDPVEFWEKLDEALKSISREKEATPKKWLRSSDVRELLSISDSTLQTLREKGYIPAYKIGSTWFYKYDEIIETLERGKNVGGSI